MPFVRGELMRGVTTGALVLSLTALAACSSGGPRTFQTQEPGGFNVFGLGGDKKSAPGNANQPAIGVNGYLWRATLDTLSFMPLTSADPWGGVVNYDWYVNPQAPNERFKATVFILDRRLRADALNVAVTKEVKDAAGAWVSAPVAAQTETDLENAILTKARQLNLANAARR